MRSLCSSRTRKGFPLELREDVSLPGVPVGQLAEGEFSYSETVARFERELIEESLRRARGVQRRAARILGLKPTTLNEKIKRLGVKLPP